MNDWKARERERKTLSRNQRLTLFQQMEQTVERMNKSVEWLREQLLNNYQPPWRDNRMIVDRQTYVRLVTEEQIHNLFRAIRPAFDGAQPVAIYIELASGQFVGAIRPKEWEKTNPDLQPSQQMQEAPTHD